MLLLRVSKYTRILLNNVNFRRCAGKIYSPLQINEIVNDSCDDSLRQLIKAKN